MKANANSVNIKDGPRYHHGDLRAALVEEGLRLLEASDADTLSLRAVARNVGVSAPAVYRHFPDKAAFLKALARAGLQRLGGAQADASQEGGPAGFAASGRAYVHFAIANPGLFRLIFTSAAGTPPDLGADPEGSAGWMLQHHVNEVTGPGANETDRRVLAYRAWSLVHGLAMLILDRQIDRDAGLALLDRIVSADSARV
jgi:AcrR family transcriptional regulator